MQLVVDAAGMLRNAAAEMTATKRGQRQNGGLAYGLADLANDLYWLLGSEGSLDGFREKYRALSAVEPAVLLPPIIRTAGE